MMSRRHALPWLAATAVALAVALAPQSAGPPDLGTLPSPAPPDVPPAAELSADKPNLELAARPEAPSPPVPEPAPPAAPPEPAPVQAAASLPPPPKPSDPELGQIRDAVAAYRRGDVAAGDAIRGRVADPAAARLLEWTALRTPGLGVGSERILAFARANPDWPGQTWLRRRAEDMLVAERKPGPVLRAFFGADKPQTPGGKLALALALRADGKTEEAATLVRETWRSDAFNRELEGRMLDAFKDTLRTADHRARMERFLLRENWELARRAAEYAGEGYDKLVKARIAVEGRSAKAAKILEEVPKALKADTSYIFSRAQLLRRTDKASEAAKVMATLPKDGELGDPDEWWVERRLVARKLLDDGDAKTAYAVASQHAAVSAERRIEAEFHAGWIALRFLRQPDVAKRHFDAAAELAGTPISLARSAYWQGRAAEAGGRPDEARTRYTEASRHGITYYGQLAGAKLGSDLVSLRVAAASLSAETRYAAARKTSVRALAYAYAAGFRELAVPLVAEFGRSSVDLAELDAVAEVLAENRDARALLTLGKLSTQRGLPLDETAFPTEGVPSFEPVGATRVERAMVQAIARQESAFDPAAVSHAGARGLMQMMPATARATAKKAGVEFDLGRLGDATYNASLGAAHLGDLMEDWRGSYILTFASYNAGPGNVKKWIQAYGDPRTPGVDAIDWVERIPFSETRNYVQRVMENLQVYRKRLDARSALLIESDLKRGGTAATTGSIVP